MHACKISLLDKVSQAPFEHSVRIQDAILHITSKTRLRDKAIANCNMLSNSSDVASETTGCG
jgi:hypothetical protein